MFRFSLPWNPTINLVGFCLVLLMPQVIGQNSESIEKLSPPISLQPRPVWVDELPLDLETKIPLPENQSREGYAYRLIDLQKNAETGESFSRYAIEFFTFAGVHDHAEIAIEYDPEYEILQIHDISIHRDGRILDGRVNALVREVLPEDELDEGMLSGHRRLVIFPSDVRPGDVLEYSCTHQGANPYFRGRFFDEIEVHWEARVLKSRYRLIKNKKRGLFIRNHRTDMTLEMSDFEGGDEWIWLLENIQPVLPEPSTPKWYQPFGFVELSEFQTWAEVAELGRGHYGFGKERTVPGIQKMAETIRSEFPDQSRQITAAIRFVQDEVRYLGIEEGGRAYIPADPGLTFQRRYGDCKDKTVLLAALLRELGVKSTPMYVDINEGRTLERRIASPLAFDHVVLKITPEAGGPIFCDCTLTHTGGIAGESSYFPSYYFGLPLFEPDAELERLPDPASGDGASEVNLHSVAQVTPGEIGEAAELRLTTQFSGADADANRYYAETDSATETRVEFLNYIREDYGQVTVLEDPRFKDNREANILTLHEHYRIDSPWEEDETDPGWFSFSVFLPDIRDLLSEPRQPIREMPFAFSYPQKIHQEIQVVLEKPGEWEFEPELHFIEGPAFTMRREIKFDQDAGILYVIADFESLADHVLPGEMEKHIDAVTSAYELMRYELWALDDSEEEGGTTLQSSGEAFEPFSPEVSGGSLWLIAGLAIGGCFGLVLGIGIPAIIRLLKN